MKANTNTLDLANLRIFDVIPFYEEYDIMRVIYRRMDARSGYLRFEINGKTPDNTPYVATRVFTIKNCVRIAREIRDINQHHIDCGIGDAHEISFENFGKLLD